MTLHQEWLDDHVLPRWLRFWGDLGATHFFHHQKFTVWSYDKEGSMANGVVRYVGQHGEKMECGL